MVIYILYIWDAWFSKIKWFYFKPDVISSWFLRQGRCTQFFDCRFWKGDPYFISVLHCNYTSIVHRFWFNELFMFAGNDVIAISSLGVLQVISDYGFWKGDPNFIFMFNWHFLSILNGLDVIRLCWDFPKEAKFRGFWGKMTTKTSNERKTLAGRALSYAILSLLSHCAWNYFYPFGLCRCTRKKDRKAGRKKSHKKCIFHVSVERLLAGGFEPNLANVFVSPTIKRAKFHRYNLRGFGAVRCWSFNVAIGNPCRPSLTLCFALPHSRW